MIFRKSKNVKKGDFVVLEGMSLGVTVDSVEYLKEKNEVRIFVVSERNPKPCLVLLSDDYVDIRDIPFKYFEN